MKTFFLLPLFFVLTFSCFAQTVVEELIQNTDVLNLSTTVVEVEPTENELGIFQKGDFNEVNIVQRQTLQNAANAAILNQNGFQNTMLLNQIGSNHNLLATQIGNNNELELNITGEDVDVMVVQDGDNNIINQNIENGVDIELNLIQDGNNNSMEQDLNVENGMNMTIKQTGNNASLKIIHNN